MDKRILLGVIAALLFWILFHGVVFTNYYPHGFELGVSFYVGSLS